MKTLHVTNREDWRGRWVDEAKKEETRQQRLQKAIRMLEANEKLGLK